MAGLFPTGGTVIFTGSATEAINLAMRGAMAAGGGLAVSAIEHAAVLDTAQALGNPLSVIPVDREGLVAEVAGGHAGQQ